MWLQRREFPSSSQPPCCCVRLWGLHKQPQPCPKLGICVRVFSERLMVAAGDSGGKAELVSRQLTQRCLLPALLCLELLWSLALRAQLSKDVNQSNDRGSRRGGSSAALSDGQLKNRPIYL